MIVMIQNGLLTFHLNNKDAWKLKPEKQNSHICFDTYIIYYLNWKSTGLVVLRKFTIEIVYMMTAK